MLFRALLLAVLLPCSAPDWGPQAPVIRLNSEVLTQSQVVLSVGEPFALACEGTSSGSSVSWSTSALKLHKKRLDSSFWVRRSFAAHTGTYTCVEQIQDQTLSSHVNVFVKDPANLFIIPHYPDDMMEGADLHLGCILTDPSATDLALRLAEGDALPSDLNYTADPQRGVVIRQARTSHSGRYVCSARIGGVEHESKPFFVNVIPRPQPPWVSLVTEEEYVRIVGEALQITCLASNPSHFFNVTWKHSSLKVLKEVETQIKLILTRVVVNSTVSVPAVSHADGGTFTCVAINEGGANATSAHLTVVDGPYLRVQIQSSPQSNMSPDQETGGQETGDQETGDQGTGDQERGGQETGGQETGGQETGDQDTGGQETGGQETGDQDTGGQETGGQGTGGRLSRGWVVEVREGEDLELRVQMEAYPPILSMLWETPTSLNSSTRDQLFTRHNHRFEASLQVRRVSRVDGGVYLLHYKSKHFNNSVHFHVRILREPSALIRLGNSSTLTCTATGYRLPTILWYQCLGIQDSCGDNHTLLVQPSPETMYSEDRGEAQSQLDLQSTTDDVTVECVASNDIGTSRDVFVSYAAAASAVVMLQLLSPILIGPSSAAGVLLLLLLVVLYKYRQKPKYEIRWKIIETSSGNSYSFVDPTQLPYNEQWEFPRDRLRLGSVLGAGAFGKVVEATAYGLGSNDDITRVAVKMLKPSAHSEEREALMSELKILSHLGHHDNIVNLLGACTQGGPMLMITEYCSHGDLLNFLRRRAQDFMDAIFNSPMVLEDRETYKNMAAHQARTRSDSGISCSDSDYYLDMQPIGPQPQGPLVLQSGEGQTGSWSLDMDNLLVLSYQVAQGMDFLASRNCIHRDVAARNVLLTEHRVAKICDFGLARDVMNDSNYVVKGNARLPVKWMAPESIFDCVYTVQSDVWSYGILLWEIFSLGNSPYPNMVVDTRFYKMIKDGRHMSRPDFSPPEMYSIMTQCWDLEPTERPTFTTIGQLIHDLLPKESHQPYGNIPASTAVQAKGEEEEEEEGQSTKSCEEDCDRQTATREEEEQPLMKNNNNYQVC